MKAKDLSKILSPFKNGWVAVDEKRQKAVAHAKSFSEICEKVGKSKKLLLVPASSNYFGFVTTLHVKISVHPSK